MNNERKDLLAEYSLGKNYLSFGGGVNSVALMLWLIDHGIEFEAVFSNHGGDYPETYDYLNMLLDKGYPITVLDVFYKSPRGSFKLYDYLYEYRLTPTITMRWCTRDFKVQPIVDYVEKPCFMMIGISAEESHRAKRTRDYAFGIVRDYPLVDHSIDREGCKEIIRSHGLPLPPKSGCFFCPFQKRQEIRNLYKRKDDLFCRALTLEKRSTQRGLELGKRELSHLHSSNLPLEVIAMTDQEDLFDDTEQSCVCHS